MSNTQVEELAREFKAAQSKFEENSNTEQQLRTQLHENETVEKEFDNLEADATVYKLVGPVLVREDLPDAKENVKKRIQYIKEELKRVEKSSQEQQKKTEQIAKQLQKVQSKGKDQK
eukprot:GHVN01025077.1.p2 GENE.GHVN01025077.1~~GHVN01025077.1.p2  ORF type:complete len:117 (-),score=21.59 GHVN01025077.1:133-483(-)